MKPAAFPHVRPADLAQARRVPPLPVIGNLPPPVTGQAAITLAAARWLARAGPAPRLSLSPGAARGPWRHPVRAARTLRAAAALLVARLQGGRRAYLAGDGGWGRGHQLLLILVARALGMRLRLHHHSFAYLDRPDRLMRLALAAGGGCLDHVFLSPAMRARFRAAYGGDGARDLVIPNAVFLRPEPRPRPPRPPGPLRAGLLANLTAAKGLHEVIALAESAESRGLALELRLAGPVADPADLAALKAALMRLPGRLSWTGGPVSGEAKAAFYDAIDVFLLPTTHRDEAEPAVIWEAAFAGVPALAWGRGAIPEQAPPGFHLDPAEPFGPWALDRLAALQADPAALAEASRAALARAEAAAEAGARALALLLAERDRP
ncbi:glycosyltransferase [Albimonas pacifica]|uniref:Glycosyl transferases group 1 n=1 Tax=Albimonas pacifica TaxID=1114924 RepID=A0A1I3DX58_9RHOB|nr:glycosyltransferase [Albimonas pacifica]SFH91275.1 Glycosyl transferases group 1 [Albimonas pacifica]